jgi:hypothetical protein
MRTGISAGNIKSLHFAAKELAVSALWLVDSGPFIWSQESFLFLFLYLKLAN